MFLSVPVIDVPLPYDAIIVDVIMDMSLVNCVTHTFPAIDVFPDL